MHRRTFLKTGATTATVALTGLTGCSGGGSSPPLSASIQDIRAVRQFDPTQLTLPVTLSGDPGEWPEFQFLGTTYHGYELRISQGDADPSTPPVLLTEDGGDEWKTTEAWFVGRKDFAEDSKHTYKLIVGEKPEFPTGDPVTVYLANPESGETYELGSATYSGSATPITPNE